MPLSDLLDEALETVDSDCWDRERTATPVRAFAVRLHSAGLSLREKTAAILDLLDVDRSHGAIWDWTHRLADNQGDPPRSIVVKRSSETFTVISTVNRFRPSHRVVRQAPESVPVR